MKRKVAAYADLVFTHMKWNETGLQNANRADDKVLLMHRKLVGKWLAADGKLQESGHTKSDQRLGQLFTRQHIRASRRQGNEAINCHPNGCKLLTILDKPDALHANWKISQKRYQRSAEKGCGTESKTNPADRGAVNVHKVH